MGETDSQQMHRSKGKLYLSTYLPSLFLPLKTTGDVIR